MSTAARSHGQMGYRSRERTKRVLQEDIVQHGQRFGCAAGLQTTRSDEDPALVD